MRSEIGRLSLDSVLRERASLNTEITHAINDAAQAWGVTCLRYEIRDIHAPDGVVEAMHRQVTAERSKRAEILESEGQRQSAINIAEGRKQSVILASEAVQQESINKAAGEAEGVLLMAQGTARGISEVAERIRRGGVDAHRAVELNVAEKYVDAWGKMAKEGTSIVVPGNVGDMGGMIAGALGVYGKVSEGMKASESRREQKRIEGGSGETESERLKVARSPERALDEGRSVGEMKDEVANSVLQGFEDARR